MLILYLTLLLPDSRRRRACEASDDIDGLDVPRSTRPPCAGMAEARSCHTKQPRQTNQFTLASIHQSTVLIIPRPASTAHLFRHPSLKPVTPTLEKKDRPKHTSDQISNDPQTREIQILEPLGFQSVHIVQPLPLRVRKNVIRLAYDSPSEWCVWIVGESCGIMLEAEF